MEVLNTSYTEDLKITRNGVLGFLVIEPENLCFKYAIKKKDKKGDRPTKKLETNVEDAVGEEKIVKEEGC